MDEPAGAQSARDRGRAQLDAGDFAAAIASYRDALGADMNDADAWVGLAQAYEGVGESRSALTCYDRATGVAPALAEAWYRSGALAHTMSRFDDAVARFTRAHAADARSRWGLLGAARAFLTRNQDADAERALREAVAVDADNAIAHDLLGNLLANWGRFDAAREHFERAVALSPALAGSWYDLVRCRRIGADEQGLVARLDAALATPGLAPVQRQRLLLAAGKVADDLGDHALAMRHFDAADALRPGTTGFDSAAFDRIVDSIIERCTPELVAQAPAYGNPSTTPLLVTGLPRSGTTLVEQVIASHPDVFGAGELPFWSERGAAWHLDAAAARDPDFLPRAGAQYLDYLREISGGARHVTDKMPFNVLWAGAIHLALPNAVIVHCRRSPIDTALSIHQTLFHPELGFPTGGAKLVAYFRSVERLVQHWRRVLPADRFVEVEYEALTQDPEPQIRRLVAACGLSWDDACLRPHLREGVVRTPSKWQSRQPINRGSVERWRRYEPWLGELRGLL